MLLSVTLSRSGLLLHVWPVLLLVMHVARVSLGKLHVHVFELRVDVFELVFSDNALIKDRVIHDFFI